MSGNEMRNLDMSTCIAEAYPGEAFTPSDMKHDDRRAMTVDKTRNILRLAERGEKLIDVASFTYGGELPDLSAPLEACDKSPTHNARKLAVFNQHVEKCRDIIIDAGLKVRD